MKWIIVILTLFITSGVFSQSPDTLYPVKVYTQDGYKYGYINNEGYLSIKPQYDYAKDFSEGLAFVKNNNNSDVWECINTNGVKLFQINAKFVYNYEDGFANFIGQNDSDYRVSYNAVIYQEKYISSISDKNYNKLIPYIQNDKWGYKKGFNDTIIAPKYERAGEFSEGLAPAFIKFNESDLPEDNCYNIFINEKGDVVIKVELKYDDHGYLESGYFYTPGKWVNGVCRYFSTNDPNTRVEKYLRSDGKIIW